MSDNLTTTNPPTPPSARVLLVGDVHGNIPALEAAFRAAQSVGALAIIQLGDFGFGWAIDGAGRCSFSFRAARYAEQYGVPLYFIDGNHENFDRLEKIPVDPATGHRPIFDGVTHLPRASTLTIAATRFRAFGGAYSVDIDHRTPHKSWWPQETVTEDDVARAIAAGPADVFLSHDVPAGTQDTAGLARKLRAWGPNAASMSLANQEQVRRALIASGARWAFHGHLHEYRECYIDANHNLPFVTGLHCDGHFGNRFVLPLPIATDRPTHEFAGEVI